MQRTWSDLSFYYFLLAVLWVPLNQQVLLFLFLCFFFFSAWILIFHIVESTDDGNTIEPESTTNKYPDDEKLLAQILDLTESETIDTQDSQGFTALIRSARAGKLTVEKIVKMTIIQKQCNCRSVGKCSSSLAKWGRRWSTHRIK